MRHDKHSRDLAKASADDATGAEAGDQPETASGDAEGSSANGPASSGGAPAQGLEDAAGGTPGRDDQRERYLRLAAEYDNYRKRTLKERQEAGSRAQAELIRALIDPLDDLARFAHVDPASTDPATITQGVDMVERKMMKALTALGLEVVNPVDQAFDPKLHEAVSTERALSPEDDHVVARVYQLGYVLNGQLLRPARVVVKQWQD